jgi:hypothetical protein
MSRTQPAEEDEMMVWSMNIYAQCITNQAGWNLSSPVAIDLQRL